MLDLVGLANDIKIESTPLEALWDATATGHVLGQSSAPNDFTKKYYQPATGIRRTTLVQMLKDMLLDLDVEVREGWELIDIEETEGSVTAFFNGNRSVTGSFLVGCDGIKSASRRSLLKIPGLSVGSPIYTGLTQVCSPENSPSTRILTLQIDCWYIRDSCCPSQLVGDEKLVRRWHSCDFVSYHANSDFLGCYSARGPGEGRDMATLFPRRDD